MYLRAITSAAFAAFLCIGLGSPAMAQTPDGEPPAVESVCDDLTGAAFGLCNAYCEAMDCHDPENAKASASACTAVKGRLAVAGVATPPCEDGPVFECPCFDTQGILEVVEDPFCTIDAVNTLGGISSSIYDSSLDVNWLAWIGEGTPDECVNDYTIFTDGITPAGYDACKQVLLEVAAARNVECITGGG